VAGWKGADEVGEYIRAVEAQPGGPESPAVSGIKQRGCSKDWEAYYARVLYRIVLGVY